MHHFKHPAMSPTQVSSQLNWIKSGRMIGIMTVPLDRSYFSTFLKRRMVRTGICHDSSNKINARSRWIAANTDEEQLAGVAANAVKERPVEDHICLAFRLGGAIIIDFAEG